METNKNSLFYRFLRCYPMTRPTQSICLSLTSEFRENSNDTQPKHWNKCQYYGIPNNDWSAKWNHFLVNVTLNTCYLIDFHLKRWTDCLRRNLLPKLLAYLLNNSIVGNEKISNYLFHPGRNFSMFSAFNALLPHCNLKQNDTQRIHSRSII